MVGTFPKVCDNWSKSPSGNSTCIGYEIVLVILNVPFCLIASLGNAAVLMAIWRTPSLHSAQNFLLANLASTDLAVGLTVQPLYIASNVLRNNCQCYKFHEQMEDVTTTVGFLLCGASFLSLSAITIDRLLALELHLRYDVLVTPLRVLGIIAIIWFVSGFLSGMWWWCETKNVFITTAIIIFPCMAVSFVAFFRIYSIVRRHQAQIQSQEQNDSNTARTIFSFTRLRKSSFNAFCLYVVFVLCYSPFLLAMLDTVTSGRYNVVAFNLTTSLVLLNSSLNAALNYLCVPELRKAVKQVVLWLFAKSSNS